jgi:recombination protein RecA
VAIDKAKLKAAFKQIEAQHGAGTVFILGSSRRLKIDVIPSVLGVDIASGVGGFPRGRIVEVYGPESGGKTTLTLHVIANAQKAGGLAAFIDAEHALDPVYARRIGVNTDQLVISQPDNGEQALEVAETLIKSEQFAVVVVDSVAALVPKKELEGEMGDAQMGSQARLMSQAMRKLNAIVAKTGTCLIFINQVRDKIGVMYGNPETTTGGRALKFYASMRITVRPNEQVKEGSEVVGIKAKIKFAKNKLASPFKETMIENRFGIGFDPILNLVDEAVELKVLEKRGSRYVYNGEEIANGLENTVDALRMDPAIFESIDSAARAKAFQPPAPVKEVEPEQEEE